MNDKTSTLSSPVELLAPAGDAVCLRAAVRAGADAVYLGMGAFNARRGAENFTAASLAEACRYAHLRGVKIFLTLNTIILPGEVDAALEVAAAAAEAGVDAFIVQDIGLAAALVEAFPQVALHISTQMNTLNADGIRAASALGAKRVTLGRELTLAEVAQAAAEARELGMQVEAFAHGALCVCYSGQCFFSSMVGGRSANRGMCAQACRLPYELRVAGSAEALPAEGEHLLSPKDLCTIDMLSDLVCAGVASLKIEGRMKSPEYVYAVVSTYREVLDRVLAAGAGAAEAAAAAETATSETLVPQAVQATAQEKQRLEEVFSRGFTTAYLDGKRDNSIMSYQRPNNRGVLLGRVSAVRDGWFELSSDKPVLDGDVIEVWTGKGRAALTVSGAQAREHGVVRLALDAGNRDQRAIREGDRVFRVRSVEAAFADDLFEPRIPVNGKVVIRTGEALAVRFWRTQDEGVDDAPVGESLGAVVEAARTKELTEQEVREHIGRFGNTPFSLVRLGMQLDAGCGLGFSALHKARAQALFQLEEALLASYASSGRSEAQGSGMRPNESRPGSIRPKATAAQVVLQPARRSEEGAGAASSVVAPFVAALVMNPACARAAKRAGAAAIYVPAVNYKRGLGMCAGVSDAQLDQAGYPKRATLVLPVANRPSLRPRPMGADFDVWELVAPDASVLAENLGDVHRACAYGNRVEVGPHVPVTNSLTLAWMERAGVDCVWLSPELTLEQIRTLLAQRPAMDIGITVFGRTELMVCEHCVLMSQGSCAQSCDTCERRTVAHVLKDRKGYEFPVITDVFGRSHVYNSVALDTTHAMAELLDAGVSRFMVDTTMLTQEETAQAVGRAVRALESAQCGEPVQKATGFTTGHLFRGVS